MQLGMKPVYRIISLFSTQNLKELLKWKSRHARNKFEKKEKGPVEPGKEEEEDKLESFFCQLYEFHNPAQDAPAFVPAELPRRYFIKFVPAVSPVTASPVGSYSCSCFRIRRLFRCFLC